MCWIGKTCEERLHRIPKFNQTVFTFETKFSNWVDGSLIGSLSLSDENSSLASCGSVQFNIVSGSNYLPVAIDGTTGILKVIESDYETMKNNHTITFQVTVRNANTSLNISDNATVNILIGENYSDEETGSEITAVKRGVILPPNTINVTFSRVYIQDNPNYCLFDTWFIDSVIFLPPGNNSLIMKFSGPSLNNVYYGYIQYLFAYYNGSNIVNNYPVKFSNLTYLNNYSSPSSFLMTSQILVSSDPADDEKNFSIRMRFKTGLFPERTPPPMGASLVVTTEALLTPKITVDFSMVVSSNCPTQYDAVNFIKCPQSVNYGGVYNYSVNFFISRPIGDYTFTFSTDQYSASIGHISLTLPPTFATYPEGYKINTEEFVTSNAVLTTFGYVSVTNLLSPGTYDTSLSVSNRSVLLTVFIQISNYGLTSTKFEAKVSPTGENSTVNVCESQVSSFTNYIAPGKNFISIKDIPVLNQVEKTQFFTVQLTVTPNTYSYYILVAKIQNKILGEMCYIEYLLKETNQTRKVRLISEYTILNSRRSVSSTPLGIFENKSARNITYNFVFGIKLCYDTSYVTGDVIQIQFTLSTDTLTVNTQNVVFSINSMVQPPSIIPPSKVPTLTIEKIEPRNSQPLVNFAAIVECRAKFFEDLVYTAVTLVIQANPAYGIIIRKNIQTVGYLLRTMAPVSPSYITKPDSIIAQLNTVYFNETCTDSQCDIAFRYSVMPITTKPFVITFKLSTLGSLFTKTLTITAQTNYSIQMPKSQEPQVQLVSLEPMTIKNQLVPNAYTWLKLSLIPKPNVWGTIDFRLYAPGSFKEYIFLNPRLKTQCSTLPFIGLSATAIDNMVYINVERTYYEGIVNDSTLSLTNEISYHIPMFTANYNKVPINFTYNMTIGSYSTSGSFMFITTTPAVIVPSIYTFYRFPFDDPKSVYTKMCTGEPVDIIAVTYPKEKRCSYITQWINRLLNNNIALNISRVWLSRNGGGVWIPRGFTINMTYVDSLVRVDFGPVCPTYEANYFMDIQFTTYILGDCNTTQTTTYSFPGWYNMSGNKNTIYSPSMDFVVIPNFPVYIDILAELLPIRVNLQPGGRTTITVKYIFPLNSTYPNSSVEISGGGANDNNETIISIIDFRISLGSNLVPLTTVYSSTYEPNNQTGLIDHLIIRFKNISNIGTVSVPLMRNTAILSVDIQLSDSKSVENGTVWLLQFAGRFNNITKLTNLSVTCVRTGLEKPSIKVVPSQLSLVASNDCPDRDEVYLQTLVQMMNGTGLECERQSIIFYLSPQIQSIDVFNKTGNTNDITLKTALNPVSKSVQFTTGHLYFGKSYAAIFRLKFKSSRTSVEKYPVLIEVVCKPYERNISVFSGCVKSKFYKFRSHIHVELDYHTYSYPCDLPHYKALRNPAVPLPSRQSDTFLNVRDRLFYCGRAFNMKGSFDLEKRCFMISKLPDRIWIDMGPFVEQIIAYTNPLGILFGLGANGEGVMMSKNFGKTWISINPFMYQNTLNTSTEIITASVVPWISSTGSIDNTLFQSYCKMRVAEQWNDKIMDNLIKNLTFEK
ncbi:unnamed protein product [Schistosoma curassoni]|nr:unnamed protein product [Schistosoma curassoni]